MGQSSHVCRAASCRLQTLGCIHTAEGQHGLSQASGDYLEGFKPKLYQGPFLLLKVLKYPPQLLLVPVPQHCL